MNITSIKFRIVKPYMDRIETLQFEANVIDKNVKYTLLKTFTKSNSGSIKSYKDKPVEEKSRNITDEEMNKLLEFVSNIDYNTLSTEEIKYSGANGEESVVFSIVSIEPLAEYYKELNMNCKPSEWTWVEKMYNYVTTVYDYNKRKKSFWETTEFTED